MTRHSPFAAVLAALFLAACGASPSGSASGGAPAGGVAPAGQSIVVATSPGEADVAPGGKLQFGAQVTGTADGSVAWQVVEPEGGSVDAAGLYTAPATEGTFHVRAVSAASAKSTGSSVVRVKKGDAAPAPPAVVIAIDPAEATLDACAARNFAALVTGSSNVAVTWSVVEAGGGTVTGGAYVAPPTPGTYHLLATSQADPTRTAQATVAVGPEKVLSIALTPGNGTVPANGTLALAARVTTTCGTYAAQ